MKKKIVIALSGGVDSSVAALLLKEMGHDVIGMFMKNWEDPSEHCTAAKDFEDVVSVCSQLDIPYYTINFTKEYREQVFAQFLEGLKKGLTPNPDTLCNREIKFKALFEKALSLGADALATGHYAQIHEPSSNLLKGTDPNKDQSYFLYGLSSSILEKVLFPVGHLPKDEVRTIARNAGLSTADKKDSTGICFIGERNFKEFVKPHLGSHPGDVKTLGGKKMGTHDGIAFYTLGQRKGLSIGGPGDAWFVVGKDVQSNVIYVAQGKNHPALFSSCIQINDLNWIGKTPSVGKKYTAKIRYRQPEQSCVIEKLTTNVASIRFAIPQRAATPGQALVLYDGEICLGGGIICSCVH